MTVSGAALFARYAYPPNKLGYCGPADASVLLERGSASAEQRIAKHARKFEGAWPYLEIIASAAGIANPLDRRVVEAYWIGNELLDGVNPDSLVAHLQERFVGQSGASWVPGPPHHSFHVYAVYPWVGLLDRGVGGGPALSVLDACRIRTGVVVALEGNRARVRSRPLVLRDGLLQKGVPRDEHVVWAVNGRELLAPLLRGDVVAMHWDWVCDVLTPEQATETESRHDDQLARMNAAALGEVRPARP